MSRPVSVVVPAHNEELRLPALLNLMTDRGDELFAQAGLAYAELIVVDDGSTDATAELVRAHGLRDGRVRLVSLGHGRGKGAAVRAGVLAAGSDWALVMDADLATPVDEVGKLAAAADRGADIAIGSRGLEQSVLEVRQPGYRELAGKAFNLMVRVATGLPYRDTQCGFKLFRLGTTRELFEQQRIEGFAFDVELLVRARARGLEIREVPVRWINDPQTRVKLVRASARMAFDLIRIVLAARAPGRRGEKDAAVSAGRGSRHKLCN